MRRLIRSVPRKGGGADGGRSDTAGPASPVVGQGSGQVSPLQAGLDVVANPVLLVRQPGLRVAYANPAAESTFAVSRKAMLEQGEEIERE